MIRVALIEGSHLAANYRSTLPRLPSMNIIGVVDDDKKRAEIARDALRAEFAFDSLERLLAQVGQDIDAVLIHSNIARRCELVCRTARAGKHVWVASPMASSVHEADQVIETCRAAGILLVVGQELRYRPYQRTVHERLAAGKLGVPGLLRIHHWNVNLDERSVGSRVDDDTALIALLTGDIDLSCWLFSDSPTTVYAVRPRTAGGEPTGDVQVHLGFHSGGMALIDCSVDDKSKKDPYFSLTMIGSTGAAYADDHHNVNLCFHENGTTGLQVDQGIEHVRLQLQEFVEALEPNRQPKSHGGEDRRAIAVAQAAVSSLAAHRVTHLVGERYEF